MKYSPFALLLAATAVGQSTWVAQSPSIRPSARTVLAMTYDAATRSVLVYGGFQYSTFTAAADLWRWDGVAWAQLPIQASPTALAGRDGCGFCPDVAGGVLLFDGFRPQSGVTVGATFDETWRMQPNGTCTLVPPALRPPPRRGMGMTLTNQGVVLFGGQTWSGGLPTPSLGDTWRWDGSAWNQLTPPSSPAPRSWHAMAFDSNRNVVVLFGGAALFGPDFGDTWEFDGTTWLQRFPAHSPSRRSLAGMAFAAASGRTVLFGGFSQVGAATLADTWLWDGTDWQALPTVATPPERSGAGMTYDAARQQVFLFGGRSASTDLDDCHYLDLHVDPSTYTPFGAGCVGPNALTPALASLPGEVPAIGTTSHLRVTNLPMALTVPVFVLGLSNALHAGPPAYPLPFDLGGLGWPGCQQLVSFDVGYVNVSLTGQADLAFTVPFQQSLIGLTFHAQVFVLYQPTGGAVSNGIAGRVGV